MYLGEDKVLNLTSSKLSPPNDFPLWFEGFDAFPRDFSRNLSSKPTHFLAIHPPRRLVKTFKEIIHRKKNILKSFACLESLQTSTRVQNNCFDIEKGKKLPEKWKFEFASEKDPRLRAFPSSKKIIIQTKNTQICCLTYSFRCHILLTLSFSRLKKGFPYNVYVQIFAFVGGLFCVTKLTGYMRFVRLKQIYF